jgi:hypothetical protein
MLSLWYRERASTAVARSLPKTKIISPWPITLRTNTDYALKKPGPADTTLHQTWYMNEDTLFQGSGDSIDFDNCVSVAKINLTPQQIAALVTKPGRPNKGFKPEPGVSTKIEEQW